MILAEVDNLTPVNHISNYCLIDVINNPHYAYKKNKKAARKHTMQPLAIKIMD